MEELLELGSPVTAFLKELCVIGPGHQVPVDELYRHWEAWAKDQGREPGNKQMFGRDLGAACPGLRVSQRRADNGGRARHYEGVDLTADARATIDCRRLEDNGW
jgi:putative DNA primase/helicase